jgi:hypothetical protein
MTTAYITRIFWQSQESPWNCKGIHKGKPDEKDMKAAEFAKKIMEE